MSINSQIDLATLLSSEIDKLRMDMIRNDMHIIIKGIINIKRLNGMLKIVDAMIYDGYQNLFQKCSEIENGIYEYILWYCKINDCVENMMNQLYMYKIIELTFLLKSENIIHDIKTNNINLYNLPFMAMADLYPNNWKKIIEKNKLYNELNDPAEILNDPTQVCNRCKGRKFIVRMQQMRCADEPMTIIKTCVCCNKIYKM